MSWQAIDSADVLRELLRQRVVGVRMMCLDADPALDWASLPATSSGSSEQDVSAWRAVPFAKRFELSCMDTDPASVVVFDGTSRQVVGAYAWTGPGGAIPGSRDSRVIQLADALEADYRGTPNPVVKWLDPEISTEDGKKLNPAVGSPAFTVEQDLGEARGTMERMSMGELLDVVGAHCTPKQARVFERLVLKKGHSPLGVMNIRQAGGAVIQQLCPILEDRFGRQWMISPDGHCVSLERHASGRE
jgi:hypothetical protein